MCTVIIHTCQSLATVVGNLLSSKKVVPSVEQAHRQELGCFRHNHNRPLGSSKAAKTSTLLFFYNCCNMLQGHVPWTSSIHSQACNESGGTFNYFPLRTACYWPHRCLCTHITGSSHSDDTAKAIGGG